MDLLANLVMGVLGFFNTVLPDDPFAAWIAGAESLSLGMGYLNWFVPIGDLLAIFAAYLALLLVWAAVDFAFRAAGKTVFGAAGGGAS